MNVWKLQGFYPFCAFLFQHVYNTPLATHLAYFGKDSDLELTVNIILQAVIEFYYMLKINWNRNLLNKLCDNSDTGPDSIQFNGINQGGNNYWKLFFNPCQDFENPQCF